MASHWFNYAKQQLMNGGIDLDTDDIRAGLFMSNTTIDTENDGISTISGFTTLDECDGAGYSRLALTGEAVNLDDANDRAEFDADDANFGAVSAATRDVIGALVYKHVTNDTDSIPIAWVEFATAKTMDGSNFTIQWNTEGILQLS